MTRKSLFFLAIISFMISLNVWAYFIAASNPVQGTYFSEGIFITSNGGGYSIISRIYSDPMSIQEFHKFNGKSVGFRLKLSESKLAGRAVFLSDGNGYAESLVQSYPVDRDIAFNMDYISKANSKLTIYNVLNHGNVKCIFIKEIQKTKCFGSARADN